MEFTGVCNTHAPKWTKLATTVNWNSNSGAIDSDIVFLENAPSVMLDLRHLILIRGPRVQSAILRLLPVEQSFRRVNYSSEFARLLICATVRLIRDFFRAQGNLGTSHEIYGNIDTTWQRNMWESSTRKRKELSEEFLNLKWILRVSQQIMIDFIQWLLHSCIDPLNL